MSSLQITLIVAVVLPALAIVLWPLVRGRDSDVVTTEERPRDDRRLELEEEKVALYRALRELQFDHDAGHLSDADYDGLRARYETRAAALITDLDALGPAPAPRAKPAEVATEAGPARVSWTRQPVVLADPTMTPPGSRLPVQGDSPVGPPNVRLEPGKPIPPEMLAGMLNAARQSLFDGNYSQAIAAYQAVLKRDARNVDALTHMGLIVAIGGHADTAIETIDKALAIDPKYAPAYLYRGQVLFEQKQDYAGAVKSWESFLKLVPKGEDHDRVVALVETAKSKRQAR